VVNVTDSPDHSGCNTVRQGLLRAARTSQWQPRASGVYPLAFTPPGSGTYTGGAEVKVSCSKTESFQAWKHVSRPLDVFKAVSLC